MNTIKLFLLILISLTLNGGGWGYIDTTGKWFIEPQFDDAGDFSEGLAVVRIGYQYRYINKK